MKKQTIILSALVALSSAMPIVTMDNQANSGRSKRFARIFSNLFKLDSLKDAFSHFSKAADAASEFKENIDELVGEQKESTTSYTQDAKDAFENVAQNLNQEFSKADIPGTEKIAQDPKATFMKVFLVGISAYALFTLGLNLFGSQSANQA